MKTILLTLLVSCFAVFTFAQNNVGINTATPDASSALDVTSNNKGFLPPRVADTNAIDSPAEGLLIYDMFSHCMRYYNGVKWSDCMGNIVANTPWVCGDELVDDRDGRSYATVQIGTQCWMAESINVGTAIEPTTGQSDNDIIERYCYDNLPSNCNTYGGLYTWDEAMQYTTTEGTRGICPEGWHIPTDDEFCTLENFVDSGTLDCNRTTWEGIDAGNKLRETGTTYWLAPNTGATNSTGFSGRGAGQYSTNGSTFENITEILIMHTSKETAPGSALRFVREIADGESQIYRGSPVKNMAVSVRCIKDDPSN